MASVVVRESRCSPDCDFDGTGVGGLVCGARLGESAREGKLN